jgi:hypothetical protein
MAESKRTNIDLQNITQKFDIHVFISKLVYVITPCLHMDTIRIFAFGYFAEDTVYIKAHTDDFLYGQPDEIYTSFTGFLLVPDEGRTLHGTKGHGR